MPGEIWVLDTSSLLEIRRGEGRGQLGIPRAVQPGVYAKLSGLVDEGLLVFPKQVLDELKRQTATITVNGGRDLPYEWAKANAEAATRFRTDYQALREVLSYAGLEKLLDHEAKSVEIADPWVLALAYSLKKQGYAARVVTEDRNNLPGKMALASACGIVDVSQLRAGAFLLHKGIWPAR